MQLVVATYERFLLGYRLPTEQQLAEGSAAAPSNNSSNSTSTPCVLGRSFTHAAHQGPVRCLDAGGPWLVSGGQDDQLHIYDVKAGKDLGFMMNPGDGAITCVRLFTPPGASRPTHLLSGSDDGSIAIWQAGGDWEALKLLRGHKGPIRGLSVHPSGKLAVSVGRDRLLKLWHLGKGRCSYTARLDVEADDVAFSADGEAYALLCDKVVSLHAVAAEGGLVAKLTHSRRVTAMLLPTPNVSAAAAAATAAGSDAAAVPLPPPLLLVGLDDGRLCLWDVRRPEAPVWELPGAHKARIRAITAVLQGGGPGELPRVLATASSDGVVKLWDSSRLAEAAGSSGGSSDLLLLLGSVSTNGRITGMVLSAPEQAAAAAANGRSADAEAAAAAAAAAAKQKKKKAKKQQQQQGDAGEDGAVQKAAKKQRLQAAMQQQQQPSQSVPKQQHQKQAGQQKKQQQGKQKPGGKGKPQQGRQQQQQGGGDDPGFEVVPAPGGSSEAAPAAASPRQLPKQHKQKANPSMKQQQQQRGAASGSDGALVPRVTTVIKKKKQRPGQPDVGAAAARAAKKGGKSGKPSSRRA